MYMHGLETSMKHVFSNHSECVVGKSLILPGFNLTFQKKFVGFPKENNCKTDLKCHSSWLVMVGHQRTIFSLDLL